MTPEDITPAAAVPEPSPAPTPEPAPAPVEAPEPVRAPDPAPDERTAPASEMWQSILDQTGTPSKPIEASPDPLRPAKEAQEPWRRAPSAPQGPGVTPPAPKRWAGRYESPEALETGYTELQQARDRLESERKNQAEHAERLERLLAATMERPGAGSPPGGRPTVPAEPPPQLKDALAAIQAEVERLALGSPDASAQRLVHAVAVASQLDADARRAYGDLAIREYQQQASVESALQGIQTKFFESYPDLRAAKPTLLRQVAIEAEDALRQSRRDYGSAAYMQAWFDETAKQARASIRLGDGTVSAPGASPPSRPQPTPSPARPRSGAPFAETPAPRPQEPALSGQEMHLARVFGRGA